MIWIFALGIIWFCLIHDGFRRLSLILLASIASMAWAVILIAVMGHHQL